LASDIYITQTSVINKTGTQLDTEDFMMWREAGLLIDQNGCLVPSNSSYPDGDDSMKEDLICNSLVWLMAKLVNFMAAGDELPSELGPAWLGVPQRTLLDYWYHLKRQFQEWYDSLPTTFQPCARVNQRENTSPFSEVWYSTFISF
jgi:hypothetical protein